MLLSLFGMLTVDSASASVLSEGSNAAVVQPDGPVTFGLYFIQNRHTGRCLDDFDPGPGSEGNEVGMFTCTGGPSQKWWATFTGVSSYPYQFINYLSGECLTGAVIGRYATMEDCRLFPVLQYFETQVALSGGVFILQFNDPSGDGDILLDEYQTTCCKNGSPVGLFTFTNHSLQRWNFKPAPL